MTFLKLLPALIFTAIPALGAETEKNDTPPCRLNFKDGTQLVGEILSLDPEKKLLRLKSTQLLDVVELKTDNLLTVEFSGDFTPPKQQHHALATSKPRIGDLPKDTIRGSLSTINQEHIVLDTWYGGPLTLQREMISELDIFPYSEGVFFGPSSLDGWVTASGQKPDAWTFHNRTLIANKKQTISRKIDVPERAKIAFTLGWEGHLYFNFNFLAEGPSSSSRDRGYRLNLGQNNLHLSRYGPNHSHRDLIPRAQHNLSQQESTSIEIYLDRSAPGKNALYLDGIHMGTWTNTDDTKDMGEWMKFNPSSNQKIQISEISVSRWDGRLPRSNQPSDPSDPNPLEKLEGEVLELTNGDTVIGTIHTIADNNIFTKTIYGDVRIPIIWLRSLDVAGDTPNEPQPKLLKHEVRAWFHQGGFIHIQPTSMNTELIRGYSQVFGNAEFKLKAFSRIEFNIWK